MAQQGEQMRVGVRERFLIYTIQYNWCYWLKVTGTRLIPKRFFLSAEVLHPFKNGPVPTLIFFDTHSYLYIVRGNNARDLFTVFSEGFNLKMG